MKATQNKRQLQGRSQDRPPVRQVFIVEDHPVFREGLVQLLERDKSLKVCGEAKDAVSALKGIRRLKPDVVVVDLSLPGKSGLELIKEVRASDQTTKLLVVSMHDEALYADRVLRAGGNGYIMKQEDPEEILEAIRDVLSGHIYLSEEVLSSTGKARSAEAIPSEETSSALAELTDDELLMLEMLGQGKEDSEIARELKLSATAISPRLKELRKKLKLKSANALIRYAVCWVEQGTA